MITKETIDKVLDAARIEEVVGDFVDLKKRGTSLIGNCPFHNEKTPSFHVSVSKGIYKCFGCGAGGDSLKFIMEHEKYPYPEAIRYLANRYDIPIEEVERSPAQIATQDKRESLYVTNQWANKFFREQLWDTDLGRSIGLSYFKERGYREDIIKKFELGYSPDAWTSLVDKAQEEGYSKELLIELGLAVERDDKSLYDRFRGRVLFPIHNLTGRVLGFGGRTLKTDKTVPKYVNSPESEIYHKSNVLYGLHLAKKAIIDNDVCYLVEGYADVLSCNQAGVENVVSSSGTSLTTGQIKLISRYTRNVVILYDGDAAGIKASLRGTDMLLEEGLNVKILLFPDGNDPDSYIQSFGASAFKEYLSKHQEDFVFYKTNILLKDTGGDPIKRAEVIREVVQSIALIPDEIKVSVYLKQCSTLLDIEERVLLSELNKIRIDKAKAKDRKEAKKSANQAAAASAPNLDEFIPAEMLAAMQAKGIALPEVSKPKVISSELLMEREFVRVLLNYGRELVTWEGNGDVPVAPFLLASLSDVELVDPTCKLIVEEFKRQAEKYQVPEAKFFFADENEEVSALAVDSLANKYDISPNWNDDKRKIFVPEEKDQLKDLVNQLIFRLKKNKIEQQMHQIREELKTVQDADGISMLLTKYQMLKEGEKLLGSLLGNTVVK
ncbi:DNA primase [Sphingobacterium sp. CZ-2]|uniref:DNA primase n=1 Tax=Sphingobacterium sp. CZ-2 TaxID=2557994 RepID=UPI0010700342|nr:DNA primase [Sphingobacterium sp. CZ-2]QBR13581.1 DNA primase [Sphingobacterium sp. CZ-2]